MSNTDSNGAKDGRRTSQDKRLDCSECGEPFKEWEVKQRETSVVAESLVFTCPNGHRGVEHYDERGHLTQSMGIERSDV